MRGGQGEKKRAKALASMLGLGARPLSAATEPLVAASGSDDGDDGDALSQLGGETRAMALWALLVLGGPLYFADEVEQLLQVGAFPTAAPSPSAHCLFVLDDACFCWVTLVIVG